MSPKYWFYVERVIYKPKCIGSKIMIQQLHNLVISIYVVIGTQVTIIKDFNQSNQVYEYTQKRWNIFYLCAVSSFCLGWRRWSIITSFMYEDLLSPQ